MGIVQEVPVTIPHDALVGADWADAYEVRFKSKYATAREVGDMGLTNFPPFVNFLMKLRNIVVAPFGLETGQNIGAEIDRVGFFPLIHQSQNQIVAGMNDTHLDFRIVLDLVTCGDTQLVTLATIIKRHNWVGRAYLFIITPFHKLIVRGMLKRMASH